MQGKQPSTSKKKLSLAILLLFLGVLFIVNGDAYLKGLFVESEKSVSFESEPVEVSGFSDGKVREEDVPKRIIIPDLGIDLAVGTAEIRSGYWEVFEDKAGWGYGSGLPGEPGNQVIFAHARKGLFLPLKDIVKGERIYALTPEDWYEYQVKEIKEVYPGNTEVIKPTDDETLTLYTCSGFGDSKRLIIVAKRVKE